MNFETVLLVLRKRAKTVLSVFALIVVLVGVMSVIWPKQYTAYSALVIDAKPDPVTGAAGAAEMVMDAYVTTQIEVITSIRVAQRVVKMVGLDQDPDFKERWAKKTGGAGDISVWIGEQILAKKVAVNSGQSNPQHPGNVIHIATKWGDPKMAAALANAFAQVAVETNIELRVSAAKQYSAFFLKRADDLHRDLATKQKRLSDFQLANGLTSSDEKYDVENDKLTQLTTALIASQALRQDSESRQKQVDSINNDALPEVVASPLIASLKAQLSDAEAREGDAASRLGRNHPDYRSATAEVTALKSRISQETAKIAGSLQNAARIGVRREGELRAAVDTQKKRVLDLKHQKDQSAVLESDVTAVQKDLDAVNLRLSQANMESTSTQTNVVVLTTALPPLDPSSPKLLLNLLLAMFVGAAAGVGLALFKEFRDPVIRQDEDVLSLSNVQLLGRVGSYRRPGTGPVKFDSASP